jgi:probable HAF family extracellular repeat protein
MVDSKPQNAHACAGMALVAAALFAAAASGQVIYNLGSLGPGGYSEAFAINDNSQVTGDSYLASAPSAQDHTFFYTGGHMSDLGTLGGTVSIGRGINGSGEVVGYSETTSGLYHAFLYVGTPGMNGNMVDLGTLGGSRSIAEAINAQGEITGNSERTGDFPEHAFLYTGTPGLNGHMTDLGTLGGGQSYGVDINSTGQIAGYSYTGDNVPHAFLYSGAPGAGGHMDDLGTLGGTDSNAVEINIASEITGSSSIAGDVAEHAFLYTGIPGLNGHMADLGTLGGNNSYGIGIDDAGDVVGSSFTSSDVLHAFLYTGTPGAGGRMIDLDAWLDATDPAEGAKWTLQRAFDMNNKGLIVGAGDYEDGVLADSGTRAFLLDASSLLPEPGGLSLLMLGLASLLSRRRRF